MMIRRLVLVTALLTSPLSHAGSKADRERIAELEAQVASLEARLSKLEVASANLAPSAPTRPVGGLMEEAEGLRDRGEWADALALYRVVLRDYPNEPAARAADRAVRELEVIGMALPSLAVERWIQGETRLEDHTATLVVFWEVWCPHCRREVPRLQELHQRYADRGLGLIGMTRMTRNATLADVEDFLAESGVDYSVAQGTGATAEAVGVRGVPSAIIVRDGVVVWKGHPARLEDSVLEGVLE